MKAKEYKDFLLGSLKPWCRPAGANHVLTRCYYCKDSKTPSHGHFYILVPPDGSDLPSYFYCQKCHTTGVVTSQRLLDWGVYNSTVAIDITQHNSRVLSLPQNRKFKGNDIYRVNNTIISEDDLTKFKLGYINSRLGTTLSIQDCIDNKIVFNLNDLVKENNLSLTRDKRIVDALDSDFIGFLSYDNAFLNMRNLQIHNNLHQSINKRYVNYNVFDKFDNTHRVYIIPNVLNLADPNPIEIHMAEGPFDILSIKYNLVRSNYNKIYGAILGSGYKGFIRFIMTSLKTPNIIIHIYADKDIDRYDIVDLAEFLNAFKIPIYLHRNIYRNEKDFGVPPNRIIDSIERIK